jgi:preprotein translocase subunit Sec63
MDVHEANSVLGLDPTTATTPEEIRSAYRQLILRSHPDIVQGEYLKKIAHNKTIQLNEAYNTLKARAHWEPPCDPSDVEFAQWRSAFLRTTVFRTSAAWMVCLVRLSMGIMLGPFSSPK